jgi:hypothetical protein
MVCVGHVVWYIVLVVMRVLGDGVFICMPCWQCWREYSSYVDLVLTYIDES